METLLSLCVNSDNINLNFCIFKKKTKFSGIPLKLPLSLIPSEKSKFDRTASSKIEWPKESPGVTREILFPVGCASVSCDSTAGAHQEALRALLP